MKIFGKMQNSRIFKAKYIQKVFIILFMLLFHNCLLQADEIILADGTKYQGNILEVDKNNGLLKFDVVLDKELIGTILIIKKEEMIYIIKDDKYKDLVRKVMSEEDKNKERQEFIKRIKSDSSKIDYKINERINRHIDQVREDKFIKEAKEENEKERQHELELEKIRAQAEMQQKSVVIINY